MTARLNPGVMSSALLAEANGASVYHADWRALAEVVTECDALIVDAPYSAKTHSGHGTMARWGKATPPSYDGGDRREINYTHWIKDDVFEFVGAWHERTRGWIVSITDDVLGPIWQQAMQWVGRYAFAPLPFVAPGSRVRLAGDGPSCWTTWVVVGRPRTREMSRWGTLPGAYVLPPGMSEDMPVVGGKPTWLLSELVKDYSRPGDLVVDPCCGAGTLAVAAIRNGRRAVVGDALKAHADLAATWIANPWRSAPHAERQADERQPSLFGGAR